ncbi:MAG: helix-turn-helix transcriptional regulator [Eubacterium sp.]|jgi:transcriptional regulator with XRE-family HTH domain|nr:helix-turn-helix transcriptional regulator [Eubacterium sp.]
MNKLSERLRELRISNQLTQVQLAKLMHIGQSTYSSWESGNFYPDIDKILWLCNFYKVSADYILGRTNSFTDKNNNITTESSDISNTDENEKITNYYNRLNEENQDYIRGEMVKLYREQKNDAVENTSEKKIG